MDQFLNEEFSREEFEQLIKEKDDIIESLRNKIDTLLTEKNTIVDNFKTSSNILIDQIKELESKRLGYRPETAQIRKPLTNNGQSTVLINSLDNNKQDFMNNKSQVKSDLNEKDYCPICNKKFVKNDLELHTIICSKSVTKCKICGEYISSVNKQVHLSSWRDPHNLYEFMKNNDIDKFKLAILHGADIKYQFQDTSKSYLHLAIEFGSLPLFNYILTHNINIESKDSNGNTPLILASQYDNLEIFKKLLEKGANIEVMNNIGWNSLFYVCKKGNMEMLKLLMEKKVNLHEMNKLGDNCLKIAQNAGNQELVLLLISKGLSLRPVSSKSLRPPLQQGMSISKLRESYQGEEEKRRSIYCSV